MSLAPEDIAAKSFTNAFRGANRDEVRAYLRKVAREYRLVSERVGDTEAKLAAITTRVAQVEDMLRSADELYRAAQDHVRQLETDRATAVEDARSGEDLATEVGDQVVQVLRDATSAAHAIQADAKARAERARSDAEEQSAVIAQAARDDADRIRRQAGRVLWETQQRAAAVLTEADRAARDLRVEAERYGDEVRRDADAEADRRLAASRDEIAALMADTHQRVHRLETTEKQFRGWLETASDSLLRVLGDQVPGGSAIRPLAELGDGQHVLAEPLQQPDDQVTLLAVLPQSGGMVAKRRRRAGAGFGDDERPSGTTGGERDPGRP